MMKYPIGIQTFSEIIEDNYVYVDKTALIYNMITQGKWYFLSRPRRFGKSLLVSTLESLFRGEKDLFKDLVITNTDYAFEPHPVITLEFTAEEVIDANSFREFISDRVNALAQKYQIEITNTRFEKQFYELVTKLHEQTSKRVVLLVDEYDRPILSTLETDKLTDVKDTMNAFYAMVKSLDKHLRFVFITGVSKLAKLSVFSNMNNPRDISTDVRYAALCGYTKEELLKYFPARITELANKHNMSLEQTTKEIAKWYNGYRFNDEAPGEEDDSVYNPHSILSLLDYNKFRNYWFQTGTPTFLINRLKAGEYNLASVAQQKVDEGIFDSTEPEKMGISAILLQTGYLTIKDYQNGLYELGFPNKEVEQSFCRTILTDYSNTESGQARPHITELSEALNHYQLDAFFTKLRYFFAGVPYTITLKQEKYYQSLLFVIFKLLGFNVEAEVTTNIGRIDCVIQTAARVYVIEFKLKGTKEEALQQIKDKHYTQKYQDLEKQVVLLGVEFNHNERNIGGWIEETLA